MTTAKDFLWYVVKQFQLYVQCDQMESELTEVLSQRRSSLRACLDALFSYATIVMQVIISN